MACEDSGICARSVATGAGIAVALLATAALSGCIDDADWPRLGTHREGLGEGIWVIADGGDFNLDGMTDLLWNDPGHSLMTVWLMAGTGLLLPGEQIHGPPGVEWNAAWASDFNADGMADVRWYNNTNESTAIWLMNGTERYLPGQIIPGPAGGDWTRLASSDFNADGMADLIWRNTVTHAIEVWLMQGTTVVLKGPEIPPPGLDWIARSTGDFNADGMADVFWYNPTTSQYSIEWMSSTVPLLLGPPRFGPPGDGWAPGIGTDYNTDGIIDLLWYNATTQDVAPWLMAGTDVLLPGLEIPAPPGDGWVPAATGDFNADGMADIAWQNPVERRILIWLMAGTKVLLRGPEIPGPALP